MNLEQTLLDSINDRLGDIKQQGESKPEPVKVCKHQKRANALGAFMAKQKKPDDKMVNDLREHYRTR